MKKLNKTELKDLIKELKTKVNNNFEINVFRAVKEFLIKHIDELYSHSFCGKIFYFIGNKWVYDIDTPKRIQPIPEHESPLFCGFCDSNDDVYHYWLKDKNLLKDYGITYKDYKNFNSINSFVNSNGDLYINGKYYKKLEN